MSQDQRLLDYLRDNKQIDPLTSWKELGIYRLSSCIHRLRNQGWDIKTKRKVVENSYGESCVVALYEYTDSPVSRWTDEYTRDGFTLDEINQVLPLEVLNGFTPDEISKVIDPEAVKTLINVMKHSKDES
jgi:hypothetical protein